MAPKPEESQLRFAPIAYAFTGNLLLYACLPPLGLSWLAWLTPCCWLPLIASPGLSNAKTNPRRVYFGLYVTHVLCWLALLQGMRLAHWTTYFGWAALSFYLGIYLPLFVFTARTIHHQLKIPLAYAAATGWVCVEWIRGYVISGFSMGSLSHSQTGQLWLIQISDLGGGFAVSFILVVGAGLLYQINSFLQARKESNRSCRPIALEVFCFAVLLGGTYGYGVARLEAFNSPIAQDQPAVSVGLIQGVTYTEFELPYEEFMEKEQEKQRTYNDQSIRALGAETGLDLLVWPESMYPIGPLLVTENGAEHLHVPAQPDQVEEDQESVRQWASRVQSAQRQQHSELLNYLNGNQDESGLGKAMLIGGTSAVDLTKAHTPSYNTAVLLSENGEVLDLYHKNHLVMFGEYIPLGEVFPALYGLLPISALAPGTSDIRFEIDGVQFSPNICFESTVPHRIRKMMNTVDANQRRPDVMLNLTNDGWFWDSSMLDLHLRSNVMRAVEMRRPNLVAANTGISAWISTTGEILSSVEKKEAGFVIAKVGRSVTDSFYLNNGDLFAILCGLIALASLGKSLASQTRKPT